MRETLSTVRIFPDDETTEVVYLNVTHLFWEANSTVLTICLPLENQHVHWLRERVRHYDVRKQGSVKLCELDPLTSEPEHLVMGKGDKV